MTKLKCVNDLICVSCKSTSLNQTTSALSCKECGVSYSIFNNAPVLLDPNNDLFSQADYSGSVFSNKRISFFKNLVPSLSVNLSVDSAIQSIRESIDKLGISKVLVVGGGKQAVWLTPKLCKYVDHNVVYTDIDKGAFVDYFCDAHNLPFKSDTFDVVITTAVLEHVLKPTQVASEISRVSKVGSFIYSELPFVQQVHEGAYDFTRYTLSGHRMLFSDYEILRSGIVAGPATALLWALENFFLAFCTKYSIRALIKMCVRYMFFWVKYIDLFTKDNPSAIDAASCTFILGRKSKKSATSKQIIESYVGAQRVSHV